MCVHYRYWGTSETLLPVYQSVQQAMAKHSDVDTVVNFASSRSVYQSTMELMEYPQIKSIAIIAEGVPERVSSAHATLTQECWTDSCSFSAPERFSTLPRRRASPSLARPRSVASSPAPSRSATREA
jgi:ATP citrate (pro-S)-lyase